MMEAINAVTAALSSNPYYFSALLLLPLLLPFTSRVLSGHGNNAEPWKLPNWMGIPFIGNTLQYLLDNSSFIDRASLAMQTRDIVQFYLGPVKTYLVAGPQNVQAMFRTTKTPSLSSDKFLLMTQEHLMGFAKEDVAKFANDRTGRLAEPNQGTAATHHGPRFWFGLHHNMKTLSQGAATSSLTDKFVEFFDERVQEYPLGEEVTVDLYQFMRSKMAGAATKAIAGNALFERVGEQNLLDAFWAYDTIAMRLLYSLPKWLDPEPLRIRATASQLCLNWLQNDFDAVANPESVENDLDWHPVMGNRFTREFLVWDKKQGLSDTTRAGQFLGILLG